MALEPAWIGVIGTGVGALVTGLPAFGTAVVQSRNASKQRTHETQQAEAKREAEAIEAQRQHRRDLVASWRAGITRLDGPAEYALDTDWYETLRPYLSDDTREKLERQRTHHVPSESVRGSRNTFTVEVDRIEREWGLRE